MRIALLGDAGSIHMQRWAAGLAKAGNDVHLVSVHSCTSDIEVGGEYSRHILPIAAPWGYVLAAPALGALLKKIHPDLLNAHYATGYGLLARLCGFKPLLLSVWGSDVYDFPQRSWFHAAFLRGNLKSATALASTSHCMAAQTRKTYAGSEIFVTPFGIDESVFSPQRNRVEVPTLVIGTVKTLAQKYGIDTLIQAFALLHERMPEAPLRLEITGGGPDRALLERLAQSLGILHLVTFHGAVAHARVLEMLNRLDIYVALSREESFGVAALEAAACEKPVVVSNAEGLAEVTENEVTGFVVPKNDPESAARTIARLVQDPDLRKRMGQEGRRRVLEHYTWDRSIEIMIDAYSKTIDRAEPNADS